MAGLRVVYAAFLVLFGLSVALSVAAWLQFEAAEFLTITSFLLCIAVLAVIVGTFPLLVEMFSDEEILVLRPALASRVSLSAFDKMGAIHAAALRDSPIWSKALQYALALYIVAVVLITYIGPRPFGAVQLSAMYLWICWTYIMALAFTLRRLRDAHAGAAGRL